MAFSKNNFYNLIRSSVFKGRMSQAQVDGTQAILDSCERNDVSDPHHVAYILANVRRETGGYMLPVKETVYPSHKDKNPSDTTVIKRLDTAFAKGQLKGVKTPYWRDGAFGRGAIQLTHWLNYDKFGKKLGIPLRKNPSLALDKNISADIAVIGMRDGMFRVKKLSDYKFPGAVGVAQSLNPRRIVNGNDGSDAEVAKDYRAFYKALVESNWDDQSDLPVHNTVPKNVKNIHDGKFHSEVLAVQQRLDELGYPEVGEFDGRWGNRTKSAILAFQANNNLKLDPKISDKLLADLMVAEHRVESKSRAEATIKDLRAVGAEDVKQADQTAIGGYVLAGTGTLAVMGETLDQFDKHGDTLGKLAEYVHPLTALIQDNFWLLLIAGGLFFVWKSGVLKRIRLEKHQTGKDVSE